MKKVNWQLVIAGVLMLVLGIVALVYPTATLEVVSMIAGIGFFVAGVLGIATYMRTKDLFPISGWQLCHAVLDLVLGLLFLAEPYVAGAAMVWVFAFMLIPLGIFEIAAAMREKSIGIKQWGWMLLDAILTILLGLMFIVAPASFSYLLGFALIVEAVTLIEVGFVVGKLVY